MRTLLKTNFRRYFTHPLLWAGLLFSAFLGFTTGHGFLREYTKHNTLYMNLDDIIFMFALFAQSVVLAVLITSQHKNGIFRSKVIAGKSKGKIFLAELLTGLTVSVLHYVLLMGPVFLLAKPIIRMIPLRNTLAGAGSLLLIFLIIAALTVLLCSQMRGSILSLMLCLGGVFLLYAANYFSDDALHTPEKLTVTLKLTDDDAAPSATYESRKSGRLMLVQLPKTSGVHWSEDGIMVGKDGKPVNHNGEPLEENEDPIQREYLNPKYIGGPLRTILSITDCLNPIRPMNDAMHQFYYAKSADTTDDMLKEDEKFREMRFQTLPQYLPWQLGTFALFTVGGWLLFRKKELN